MVLDDTWLSSSPIEEKEMESCWYWAKKVGVEKIPVEKFEETFGFSFKDLTDWWNKNILKLV